MPSASVREPTGRPIRATTLTVEVATDADADRLTKAAATDRLQYLAVSLNAVP